MRPSREAQKRVGHTVRSCALAKANRLLKPNRLPTAQETTIRASSRPLPTRTHLRNRAHKHRNVSQTRKRATQSIEPKSRVSRRPAWASNGMRNSLGCRPTISMARTYPLFSANRGWSLPFPYPPLDHRRIADYGGHEHGNADRQPL